MNRQEAFKVIVALKAVYNNAFSKYTEADYSNLADAWVMCLEDYSYQQVSMGVKSYMTTNTSQFPPVPAQIIDEICKLKAATEEKPLEASEAWALVDKAIRNSAYNSQAEFDKLPLLVQKAVGSAECLKSMATDAYFNFSKEKQSFEINYNTILQRAEQDKNLLRLPNRVKEAMGIAIQERTALTDGMWAE